jgi:ABC-type Na+ transport system ATPase subunit NatA
MATTISISGLVKRFGPTRALDGLDLEVRTGEVHGFLGPNGAGKTTTLRMLLGLVAPTAGTATPTFLIIPRRGRWRRPSWPRPASPACPWARPRR